MSIQCDFCIVFVVKMGILFPYGLSYSGPITPWEFENDDVYGKTDIDSSLILKPIYEVKAVANNNQ